MTGKRITLKDIAQEAKVCKATASQALNPRSDSTINLPKETIEKIQRIAKLRNYRPHAGARSIRSNRFNNIGLFISKRGKYTHVPDGYLAGLHDSAESHGYRLTLIRLPHDVDQVDARVHTIFDEQNLDALVVAGYSYLAKRISDRIFDRNLPIVYLNDHQKSNAIYVDEVAGSESMTRYLIQRGYHKISFTYRKQLHDPPIADLHYSANQRLQGYLNAMKEAGLEPHVVKFYSDDVVSYEEKFPEDWWPQVKDCDAIYAYDDDLANQIARYLYDKNIKVPQDIGLAGYNGDYAYLSAWRRITTMLLPTFEMGKAAFEVAHELINSKTSKEVPSRSFLPKLLSGQTTR